MKDLSMPTEKREVPRNGGFPAVLFLVVLLCSTLLLWTATGTLSPYALSHHTPTVCGECRYLCNLDHSHFYQTFLFLDGAPRETWSGSVYLRRILYPLLSYPLMKLFGFYEGGLLTSLIVWIGILTVFTAFMYRRYGRSVALIGAVLLASYPGQAYWFGLPYAHSILVSAVISAFMLLWYIDEQPRVVQTLFAALFMGVTFLAYDLLPFFGPATVLLLLWRRRFLQIPLVIGALGAPTVLSALLLLWVYEVPFTNSNSESFSTIIKSYLFGFQVESWWPLARRAPEILWHNFLYSNFLYLPLAFLLVSLVGHVGLRHYLRPPEWCLVIAILAVFLFNNLAPPYEGWQMRGEWIARIYQPLFIVMVTYMVRCALFVGRWTSFGYGIGLCLLVLANSSTIVGPFMGSRWSDELYYEFYRHSTVDAIPLNVGTHGIRPFGMCRGELSR